MDGREERGSGETVAQRRLRGFRRHIIGYFVATAVLVAVNLLATPGTVWFVWPMVGWGSVLAFHLAYVMGLFGGGEKG
jgi:hypothetical protein